MDELYRLQTKVSVNASDEAIISNLTLTKERETNWLDVRPLNPRPLVICASGPSAWQALQDLEGFEYDLMALNGAYNALKKRGYKPNYYVQLDSRPDNIGFVSDPDDDTEFLLAAQVDPCIFDALKGRKVTTFHLNTETSLKVFPFSKGCYLGGSAGTVGMTALAVAGVLGYRKWILIGYDSSYSQTGESHLVHQSQNDTDKPFDVELDGRWYRTTATLAEQVQEYFNWNKVLHEAFPGLQIQILGSGLFYDFIVTNQRKMEN